MRLAIISDIHSNLEALSAAVRLIESESVDHIVCLGDIVGYGADPDPCVELVRSRCDVVVQGNHDAAVARPAIADSFTANARAAVHWTRSHITPEHLSYLQHLPLQRTLTDILFVHASPCAPEQWHYIVDEEDARGAFGCFTENLCFVGHSHFPGVYDQRGRITALHRNGRILVNVGSVGQPRDRDPRLSFGVLDTEDWTYRNVRAPYDIETAARKIMNAELPRALANRLFVGT